MQAFQSSINVVQCLGQRLAAPLPSLVQMCCAQGRWIPHGLCLSLDARIHSETFLCTSGFNFALGTLNTTKMWVMVQDFPCTGLPLSGQAVLQVHFPSLNSQLWFVKGILNR